MKSAIHPKLYLLTQRARHVQQTLGPSSNGPVGTAILGNILTCYCNWFFVHWPKIFGTNKPMAAVLRFIIKYPAVSTWGNPFEHALCWRLNVSMLVRNNLSNMQLPVFQSSLLQRLMSCENIGGNKCASVTHGRTDFRISQGPQNIVTVVPLAYSGYFILRTCEHPNSCGEPRLHA